MSETERELKIYRATLTLIKDIGFDYDGFNDADSLKDLIDELVGFAIKGLKKESPTYVNTADGTITNIFGEVVGKDDRLL